MGSLERRSSPRTRRVCASNDLCLRPITSSRYRFCVGNQLVAGARDRASFSDGQSRVEEIERDDGGVDEGSVLRAQRAMPLQRLDRLIESAEIERRVGQVPQDRAAQPDRAAGKCETLGATERPIGAADVAAGVDDLAGVNHRRPRDDQRVLGRFGHGHGPFDLAPRGIERTADAVQVAQVLTRHHFAGGFTGSDEAFGGELVERNALRLVLLEGGVGQDQRGPRVLQRPAPQPAQPPARFLEETMPVADPVETRQVHVGPAPRPGAVRTSRTAPGPSGLCLVQERGLRMPTGHRRHRPAAWSSHTAYSGPRINSTTSSGGPTEATAPEWSDPENRHTCTGPRCRFPRARRSRPP